MGIGKWEKNKETWGSHIEHYYAPKIKNCPGEEIGWTRTRFTRWSLICHGNRWNTPVQNEINNWLAPLYQKMKAESTCPSDCSKFVPYNPDHSFGSYSSTRCSRKWWALWLLCQCKTEIKYPYTIKCRPIESNSHPGTDEEPDNH